MPHFLKPLGLFIYSLLVCCQQTKDPSSIPGLQDNNVEFLRGEIALCGSSDSQFGMVTFGQSCSPETQGSFNLAIALLHSFEYKEAEKAFTKVIDLDSECAMAYWGIAMCNFHALWRPPTVEDLTKGSLAITLAQSSKNTTRREKDYIEAIGSFYTDWDKIDHATRASQFKAAMGEIYLDYPNDDEAAIFYALALNSAANLSDKTYKDRIEAGRILGQMFLDKPDHPGIAHYIIHSYDYPELANKALHAARSYASIAPASAHAQHMPSHIFTRLGLWNESIISNLNSTSSAQCYAEQMTMEGNWDEEIHATDYLVYAYLQQGNVSEALKLVDYLTSLKKILPIGVKAAYPTAAIPARFYLETRNWEKASQLKMTIDDFPMTHYPWSNGIMYFARLLGAAHIGKIDAARQELEMLIKCHDLLITEKNDYMAIQVSIMVKAGQAWINFFEGNTKEALAFMEASAELELQTEKQSLTPGEVLPAQELLGDLLIEMNQPQQALEAYQLNLKLRPKRFNGLYGAAKAAHLSGDSVQARFYYRTLLETSTTLNQRPELEKARTYLNISS